jgi:hypothetical protein
MQPIESALNLLKMHKVCWTRTQPIENAHTLQLYLRHVSARTLSAAAYNKAS